MWTKLTVYPPQFRLNKKQHPKILAQLLAQSQRFMIIYAYYLRALAFLIHRPQAYRLKVRLLAKWLTASWHSLKGHDFICLLQLCVGVKANTAKILQSYRNEGFNASRLMGRIMKSRVSQRSTRSLNTILMWLLTGLSLSQTSATGSLIAWKLPCNLLMVLQLLKWQIVKKKLSQRKLYFHHVLLALSLDLQLTKLNRDYSPLTIRLVPALAVMALGHNFS